VTWKAKEGGGIGEVVGGARGMAFEILVHEI